MKLHTFLNKTFGANLVQDMMDSKHEDDESIQYFGIDAIEDASEPSYFVREFTGDVIVVKAIEGDTLFTGNEKEFRNYAKKVLATDNQ